MNAVFPHKVIAGGLEYPGYIAAAAGAGLRAGVVPHQPITNIELLGIEDVTYALKYFTAVQLNRMANAGTFIVTQSVAGATPYIRHQLTTDRRSLNASEDSITTNVDSIAYALAKRFAPYIGRYNISPEAIAIIRAQLKAELDYRATSTWTATAGNQLISYEIVKIAQDPAFKDRLGATINLVVPYPLNYLNITLVV